MRDKDQKFIFNDQELQLIKQTFAENDELLYAVRKVLLQFPLTDPEKNLIKLSITEPVHAVLKKRILPELSDDFPLLQLPSILTTLTEQLKVKNVEEMSPLFSAKATEIGYLEQQFAVLGDVNGGVEEKIKLTYLSTLVGKSDLDAYVGLQAYLFLLGYIDPMLNFIKSIAGQKQESLEEQKVRMSRDSNK